MGRRRAAVLVGGLMAAFSGGCDGGGSGDGTPSLSTEAAGPVEGGTLRLGIARVPSLDPAQASPDSVSASMVADLLFDGLTVLPEGASAAEPALAERWASADGGRTWRFTLRDDASFSDGTPVTATDAELSLERVVSQGVASLTASRLDAVSGYGEFLAAGGRAAGADLRGIRAIDAETLEVVLDRPLASLPELVGAPAYGVVSAAAVAADGAAFSEEPEATSGPFRLFERDGDVLSLVQAPGGDAYLDGVELHQHDDLTVAFDRFTDGEIDWTLVPPPLVDTAVEQFGSDAFAPFQAEVFYGFNLADARFADSRFRQAMVQAVDREAIVDAVYLDTADVLAGVVPMGVPGTDPTRCAAGCAYDPDAARALLAQAFPAGGIPEVPIDFAEGTDEAAVAALVEQYLEAVGIPVTLRPHAAAEYSTFVVSGSQGFSSLGWIGVQASSEDYVSRLFRTGSADNFTGFSDPGVDALLDEADGTLDVGARTELLGQAEAAVLALAPILPIAQFRVLAVGSDRVEGLAVGVTGTFDAESTWLRH